MLAVANKKPSCELEKQLFEGIDAKTPEYIKNADLIDLSNPNEFVFILKKEHLLPYEPKNNPQGLNLNDWLSNYEKEARVSTAGIRGPQNVLYPFDTRFPINLIGIMLATVAKALVINEKKYKNPTKIVGREVRYNSDMFLDLIARIQAAYGIKTLTTIERKSMPIWMASFLSFKLDLIGGEYITSSHGISVKNATKDLNSQGSQYLPEESIEFVNKIKEIFEIVETEGKFEIKFSANNNSLINENVMKDLNDGIILYKEFLENGVAKPANISLIQNINNKIVVENVGGSAYRTLSKLFKELNIEKSFDWLNIEEDPFFHSIGKYDHDSKGNKCFYDYSVDATVVAKKPDGSAFFPVIESLNYSQKLKNYPLKTAVMITDPDHDRLTIAQIEDIKNEKEIKSLGIDYVKLDEQRILTVYTANQSFLLIMDFWLNQLQKENLREKHPRFMIKTTASARSWDEWAKKNDVKVVNVPVGFKEIANIMKKVEKQISEAHDKDVIITDVFANKINLGKNPRLVFAGEESGGMIIGSEELIKSNNGRIAIAMREKSATEAIIVASALISYLEKEEKTLSQQLKFVFEKNEIIARYDTREDISYYNESEPDIDKLKQEKIKGEEKRTKNDLFYLTLALAKADKKATLEQIKALLNNSFNELNFSNLIDIKFVGDGTYLEFKDKFIEIRPSGTDAKTKAYGAGNSKEDIKKFTKIMGNFEGNLTSQYSKIIEKTFYNNAKSNSMKKYLEFVEK